MATDFSRTPLVELQRNFLLGSTNSMPIAGMVCWAALGIAGLFVSDVAMGYGALYIMAGVLPLAVLLDRLRGRNLFAGGDDPLTKLFLQSIAAIAIVIPVIVIAASEAGAPLVIVLGMALFTGAIWIPYGWAAGDPVGLRRAIVQAVGSYAAYALVPPPHTASAICAVVVLCYVYVLVAAKRMGDAA
ncbi:MAG: hypothetical protein V2J14_08745 [Erythrobacter sp.]|jgi:hypothetical protein|nr:hypothetical protein [Erythrobacter sp.]